MKKTGKEIPHPSSFVSKKRLDLIKGYRVHEKRTPSKPVIVHALTDAGAVLRARP
jgi:hypothetical protein